MLRILILLMFFFSFLPMTYAVFPKDLSEKVQKEKANKIEERKTLTEKSLYLHIHLTKGSIKDLFRFVVKIRNRYDQVSTYLSNYLSNKTHTLLTNYNEMGEPSPILVRLLLIDINRLIVGPLIYNKDTFAEVKLAKETEELLKQKNLEGENLVKLNRMLLEDAYPEDIIPMKREIGGFFTKAKPIMVDIPAEDYHKRFIDLYAGKTFDSPLMPKQEKKEVKVKKLPPLPKEKPTAVWFWIAGIFALIGLFWTLKQVGSHTS